MMMMIVYMMMLMMMMTTDTGAMYVVAMHVLSAVSHVLDRYKG